MKTTSKRLLVALLTLVMAFSLAIPAMAATITIVPNNYTSTTKTDRFAAYQIFAGELKGSTESSEGTNGGMLVNITWGNSVKDVSGLLNALVVSSVELSDLNTAAYGTATTLGDAFKTALAAIGYKDLPIKVGNSTQELQKTASAVAQVLSDLTGGDNNAALAEALAKILADKDAEGEYKYLSDPKTSEWDAKADNNEGAWTIDTADYDGEGEQKEKTADNNGYYLIVDTLEEEKTEGKVLSDYLVGVFGTSTIYVKTGTPKVDKEIVGSPNPDGADYNIGDTITFKLTATLPENYGNYDKFYLQFVDTLSEGLTYDKISEVYVMVGDVKYIIEEGDNGYALAGPTEGGELTITFNNLKTLKGKKVTEGVPAEEAESIVLNSDSEIFVEYTAELNEKSLKPTGNPNEVQLVFSNDPKDSSKHGTTPKDTVYVYDFGIDIYKYDGSNNEALSGAGFAVTKKVEDTTYYALLTENEGDYYVAGWITEEELKVAAETDDLKGVEKVTVEETEYYIAAKTAEGTGALNILGLEDGAYELVELIVPDGYDAIANIPVKFTATYFEKNEIYKSDGTTRLEGVADGLEPGMLKDLTIEFTVNGQKKTVKVAENGYWLKADEETTAGTTNQIPSEGAVQADLLAHLSVPNFPEGWLPGTGGIGTTLFYLIGGLLLAGAAVYLVLSSVKKGKAQ